MAIPVVAPVAPVAAPGHVASAKSAINRGFTVLSNGVSNLQANLGTTNSFALATPFVGPLAAGQQPVALTTMQKAANIVKSAHNVVDAGGAAVSRGIFSSVEQLFGTSQVVTNPNGIIFSGVDANGDEVYVNNNSQVVNPAGALFASIKAQDGAFTVNAKQEVVNAQGERVDFAGVAVKDHRIFNLAGRIANVVAHVAALAVRIVASVLGIFASLATIVLGVPVGSVIALVVGGVKAIQNKVAANTAQKAADQYNAMRAQTILINMATHASDGEKSIRASLDFVNQFCPAVIDPTTGNEITSNVAEVTAQQARILLNAKLTAIKAAYDATFIGMGVNGVKASASKVAGAVSSVAGFGAGLVKAGASKVAGGISTVGTGVVSGVRSAGTFASNHKKAIGATVATVGGGAAIFVANQATTAAAAAAQVAADQASNTLIGQVVGGVVGLGALGFGAYKYLTRGAAPVVPVIVADDEVVADDEPQLPFPAPVDDL